MSDPARVAILILAAGGSARLGRPKQLVPFGGRPLVLHAAECALAAALGPVWVVLGAHADAVGAALAALPVRTQGHPGWATGLGGSIAAGTAAILRDPAGPPEGILLMLCDQPGLSPAHLQALATAWQSAPSGMAASGYGGARGVPALLGAQHFPALLALKGPQGAKPLLARAAELPFPAGGWDVDTPEDLLRLSDGP